MTKEEQIAKANQEYKEFQKKFESLQMATVDQDGNPNASYAPFAQDEAGSFYIFISGLSKHTSNLHHSKKASLLFIEPEADSANIFARKRLTYNCEASVIERDHSDFESSLKFLEDRFPKAIGHMKGMPDFRVCKLMPKDGLFVFGFGQAFRVAADLKTLTHLGGDNGAHAHAHAKPL